MFASWRRPSRSWTASKNPGGRGNRNDRRTEHPSLAIHMVCPGGGAADPGAAKESGQRSLLVVAQRVAQILLAVCAAPESRQTPRVGAGGAADRHTGYLPGRRALRRALTAGILDSWT